MFSNGLRSRVGGMSAILPALVMAVGLFLFTGSPAAGEDEVVGEMGVLRGVEGRASEYVVALEGLPEAPAGLRYELWALSGEDEAALLGVLEVESGELRLEGSVVGGLLEQYDAVAVSLASETAGESESPGATAARGAWTAERQELFGLLLRDDGLNGKGSLYGASEQAGIAAQHGEFLRDSAASEDMAEARRHAEHVVNILDGSGGMFFGDLNRDGQEQNPGDGVGVRAYLGETKAHLLAELDGTGLSAEERTSLLQALALVEDGEGLVSAAREQAMKLFSADTAEEASALGADLGSLLAQLVETHDGAYDAALTLATIRFYADPAQVRQTIDELAGGDAVPGPVVPPATQADVIPAAQPILPPPPAAASGERWENPADGGVYVYVPAGEYAMGADAGAGVTGREGPEHTVEIGGFWLAEKETTNEQYGRCVAAGACTEPGNERWSEAEYAQHPVSDVDWEQARAYAAWVGGRLPTEAEWEAACRGTEANVYPWGDAAPSAELSNYLDTVGDTMPAGSYAEGASPFGILDMAGNVWEWTSSLDASYPYDAADGREELEAEGKRIMRGGSFYYAAQLLRCSARTGASPDVQIPHLGLRIALPASGERWENPADGGVYVYVPAGEYAMGADAGAGVTGREGPEHTVEIGGFWLAEKETTNEQYGRCVAAGACTEPGNERWSEAEYAQHPVSDVDWEQARAYAAWVGGRLPTEAEWEAACRGTEANVYPWGDAAPSAELSNYLDTVGDTMPAGSYAEGASPFGILDMAGNVWEWTSSLDASYPYDAADGREELEAEGKRIMRGGSFYYAAQLLRCSARTGASPDVQIPHLGLRVALPGS